MSVRVLTSTAGKILEGKRISTDDQKEIDLKLSIPEYQRPYCWQDQQLEQLLRGISEQKELSPELPYYLGSLILHEDGEKLNIIDGQQRITTLVLIASLFEDSKDLALVKSLEFEHPISQQQIKHNLKWLKRFFGDQTQTACWQGFLDFTKLQFTLVITQTEDNAYRFFETQNTGGKRLGGTDIIKAHHLRAVDSVHQKTFAKQWEYLGKLDDTVNALLKSRYWQQINMRELPSHQQEKKIRDTIVFEFAEQTGKGKDIAFGRICRQLGLAGEVSQHLAQQGYALRQPLNAGVNSIRYLSYFQRLYQQYWESPNLAHFPGYKEFISWLKGLEGCGYLEGLYKACLLQYISQFGENQLETAAKKLFRVVYSRRVSNQKAVRESSIYAFVRENPVLDWVAQSYTPEQCFQYLDSFVLTVDGSNLDTEGVKRRFMDKVCDFFKLELKPEDYKQRFAEVLTNKVAWDLQ